MRYLIALILILGLVACEKDDEGVKIPELLETSPKVKTITKPNLYFTIDGYQTKTILTVIYDQELITDLVTYTSKNDSLVQLIDSTHFYYTGLVLDSTKIKKRTSYIYGYQNPLGVYSSYFETKTYKLIRNKNSLIEKIIIKYLDQSPEQIELSYNDDNQIVCIDGIETIDSLHYNNNSLIGTTTYSKTNFPQEKKSFRIAKHNSRPNPYYLISKKLGYPHFNLTTEKDFQISGEPQIQQQLDTEQLLEYCILERTTKDRYGEINQKYFYEYNNKGLVIAQYINGEKNSIDYY